MTLIEKMARNLCSKLWGDPDILVVSIAPASGPLGLSVLIPDTKPIPAWQVYIDAAFGVLYDIVSESPEISDALQPFLSEEAKQEIAERNAPQEQDEPTEMPDIINSWRSRYGLN